MLCGEAYLFGMPIMTTSVFPNSTLTESGDVLISDPLVTMTSLRDPQKIALAPGDGSSPQQTVVPVEVGRTAFIMENVTINCCESVLEQNNSDSVTSSLCTELITSRNDDSDVAGWFASLTVPATIHTQLKLKHHLKLRKKRFIVS